MKSRSPGAELILGHCSFTRLFDACAWGSRVMSRCDITRLQTILLHPELFAFSIPWKGSRIESLRDSDCLEPPAESLRGLPHVEGLILAPRFFALWLVPISLCESAC